MMKLNLGKLLTTLLLLPLMALAGSVSAKLNQSIIYQGDSATLTLTANGEDIQFPDITEIGTFPITGTSSQQSINMINGDVRKSISKSYRFTPNQSLVIPSYKVLVDGEEKMSNSLTLKVTKPSPASKNAPVQLEMKVDKTTAYVGEPIRLRLTFKNLPNVHYDKIELSEPDLKKFWVKKLPNLKQGDEGDYHTQTYTYVLFPQQEGNYTIPAPFAQLGKFQKGRRDDFFNDPFFGSIGRQLKWSKIYANDLQLNIKPLPNGLDIYGDFEIKASVDKHTVKANKPVNLTIEIKGQGNLEDIKKFELDIDNAVIYSDEPKLNHSGATKGFFDQKIAIVADRNFTIPAISFSYFDKKSQSPKTIKTKPIKITVTGTPIQQVQAQQIEQSSVPKEQIKSQESRDLPQTEQSQSVTVNKLLWYLLGLISGVLATIAILLTKKRLGNHHKQETPLRKKIKKAKDDKALFELILPYRDEDRDLKEILQKLEANIYHGANNSIDRDLLIEIMEDLEK